jgi:hypothetical protein
VKPLKKCVAAWIEDDIKSLVMKLAEIKGVSVSEYLRNLILEDLDKRTIFTTLLKDSQEESL